MRVVVLPGEYPVAWADRRSKTALVSVKRLPALRTAFGLSLSALDNRDVQSCVAFQRVSADATSNLHDVIPARRRPSASVPSASRPLILASAEGNSVAHVLPKRRRRIRDRGFERHIAIGEVEVRRRRESREP